MTTGADFRTGTRMSLDEFLALGETDGKWELDSAAAGLVHSAGRHFSPAPASAAR